MEAINKVARIELGAVQALLITLLDAENLELRCELEAQRVRSCVFTLWR
jgi:hypothetical protein